MKPLTPFMVAVHGFAVVVQACAIAFYTWAAARYGLDGLGFAAGWSVVFGAWSSHRLLQHRKSAKVAIKA